MYLDAITGDFAQCAELVALSDPNPGRLGHHAAVLAERGFGRVAQFDPGALATAIAEHGIDRVIITSPDATHARHIATALDSGADVIVEKPSRPAGENLVVQSQFGTARDVPIARGTGGHGGGDAQLLVDVFVGGAADPLGRAADWRDGLRSVAVGIAGNRSLTTGQAVTIEQLGLPR